MKKQKIIFWIPRAMAIAFILLMSLFSLDVFEGNYGLEQKMAAFFVHLIPAFILFVIVLLTWKKSLSAAISFFVITVVSIFYFKLYEAILPLLIIAGPMLLTGFLYLFDAFKVEEKVEEVNLDIDLGRKKIKKNEEKKDEEVDDGWGDWAEMEPKSIPIEIEAEEIKEEVEKPKKATKPRPAPGKPKKKTVKSKPAPGKPKSPKSVKKPKKVKKSKS